MSVFTSRVNATLDVPHDAGQTVTIRKLSPRHLEQASKAQQRQSLEDLRNMGGAAFVKELQELQTSTRTAAATAVADPMAAYDRVTLIEKGVAAWSYDVKPSREAMEDLDEETADWLSRAILKLAKPSLFATAEGTEAAQKETVATSSVA